VRRSRKDPRVAFIAGIVDRNPRAQAGISLGDETTSIVPTILPGLNRAIVCGMPGQPGGWPLGTTSILTGPEGGGKTALAVALAISFQRAGGVCCYLDAEGTLHHPFTRSLGLSPEGWVYFGKRRKVEAPPLYYEDAILEVDSWISRYVTSARAGEKMGPLVIVVDSLAKLVPRGFAKKLASGGGDVRKGTLGMVQAGYNAGWCADLGPKIADHDIAVVFIQHEAEGEKDAFGRATSRLKGGRGIRYDASAIVEVSFAGRIFDESKAGDGEGFDSRTVVGKKHRMRFRKTKIGPLAFGNDSSAEFFISTGKGLAPIGWDRPREILNEALRRGLVEVRGGWKWGFSPTLGTSIKLGKRKPFKLKALYEKAELLAELEGML